MPATQVLGNSVYNKISEILCKEIDIAIDNEDIDLFNIAINKLKLLYQDNDEVSYLLGLLYYLHPDTLWKDEFKKKSKNHLKKALLVSKNKSLIARCYLYLGHLAYDSCNFKQALKYFRLSDVCSLNSKYLQLKVYEFRLCSQIRIKGISKSLQEMNDFNSVINSYPIYDIAPEGLLFLLSNINENINKKCFNELKFFLEKLNDIAEFNWFEGIAEEIRDRGIV